MVIAGVAPRSARTELVQMSPQLLVSLFVLVLIAFVAGRLLWRFAAYRGRRIVTCPETLQPAGVELDAWDAALTRKKGNGQTVLHLQSCSRWPEKENCPQQCVSQIEASPEGTMMRNILVSWFRGRSCTFCGRAIGEIAWHDEMPALRAPDGTLREWESVDGADLLAMLATHQSVCWNCLLAEGFRRDHSSLVTDRPESPLRDRLYH
jgi:hypothetical protein